MGFPQAASALLRAFVLCVFLWSDAGPGLGNQLVFVKSFQEEISCGAQGALSGLCTQDFQPAYMSAALKTGHQTPYVLPEEFHNKHTIGKQTSFEQEKLEAGLTLCF